MGGGQLMGAKCARQLARAALLAGIGLCWCPVWAAADHLITILEWRTSPSNEIEVRQNNGEWAWRLAPSLPKQAHLVPILQLWELSDDSGQPIVVDGMSIKKLRTIDCPQPLGDTGHDRGSSGFGGQGC